MKNHEQSTANYRIGFLLVMLILCLACAATGQEYGKHPASVTAHGGDGCNQLSVARPVWFTLDRQPRNGHALVWRWVDPPAVGGTLFGVVVLGGAGPDVRLLGTCYLRVSPLLLVPVAVPASRGVHDRLFAKLTDWRFIGLKIAAQTILFRNREVSCSNTFIMEIKNRHGQ